MSDGVADLFNKQQMANTIKNETDVGRMAGRIQQVSKRFLAHWNIEAQGLAEGERGQLPNNGAYIDSKGNLYASDDPRDTTIIGHFGPDNITAVLLKFGPPKEAPKGPPSTPPKSSGNEPTPAEGIRAADVDDKATTLQFTRKSEGSPQDTSETETTLKRAPVATLSSEPPPAPAGEEAVCKVDDPQPLKGTPAEFDRTGTTLVGENNPLRIKEILEGLRIKWMKENLKPKDNYIIINLAMMSGGPAFDHGKAIERVTSCAENQILVKIERDPSGERRLYLVDSTLGLLAEALKMKPEQVQKMVESVFPPLDTLDVEPDSASGARPIPTAPKVEEKSGIPQERSRGDVTTQIGLETVLGLQIQEALVPYFAEAQKGVVKTGKIYIYRVENTYTARWKSDDSVSEALAPESSRLVAVVKVKGDLTKLMPDTYQVLQAPDLPPNTNQQVLRTLLGKINNAVETAIRNTIKIEKAK
jgi:hypothetical protein